MEYKILEKRTIDGELWVKISRTVPVNPSIVNPHPDPGVQEIEQWHVYKCLLEHAKWEAEARLYATTWPNYCEVCNGAGEFWSSYDPSPAGISLSPGTMDCVDPCSECTYPLDMHTARCPRCGTMFFDAVDEGWLDEMRLQWADETGPSREELLECWIEAIVDEAKPCLTCGWNWGNGKHDAISPSPECYCWERKNYPYTD